MEASRSFVTVVSGVPRSGTSLLMQMLGAGGLPLLYDSARPPDAHNPHGYFEWEPVKRLRRDASWLPRARGHALKVVHELVDALPGGPAYRLLLVRRDLREVVASQQRMLAPGPLADAIAPDRLAEIYRQQLGGLERRIAARQDFRLLRIEHRELLLDPLPVARRIAAFLGPPLDPPAMARTVDPNLTQPTLLNLGDVPGA